MGVGLRAVGLDDAIGEATGHAFRLADASPVHGGSIHRCYRLTGTDGRRFFVKRNASSASEMFAQEASGLGALARTGTIRVPEVIAQAADNHEACLVLEWLELTPDPDPAAFGQALAALHRCQAAHFGFGTDNWIGRTLQPNGWCDDWPGFWSRHRLGHQLSLLRQNRSPAELIARVEQVADALPALLAGHHPAPSLLHGDLWSGNWASDIMGNPVIFDPAVYYGDRETDLAMMRLFGDPGPRFFAAYDEAWPCAPGHELRQDLYNLYHLLNHWNLFGGDWAQRSLKACQRLLQPH
ncbi:MAG: fructosamine kinase family protein [Chromatiales bacterium]|nr:fructosamine kinase family protein [Chromatiales bacterium]